MKRRLICVVNAAVAVLLAIGTVDYTCYVGRETRIGYYSAKEAVQSDVVVEDFIHDNYVISEKNPWSDYSLEPVEYTRDRIIDTSENTVSASSAILIDVDECTVLYEKNADKTMYPASTTKLMTALTVLQVMDTDDVVTVGAELSMVAADSSTAGFSAGQMVTVGELLSGLLISSGNDAAYILAKAAGEAIFRDNIANEGKTFTPAQCVQRFVFEMNKNVRDMELENTNFTTPDGYDDKNQYTTAGDLSKIAMAAYHNQTIKEICKRSGQYSKTLNKTWKSTNELIHEGSQYYCEYCLGLKTGSTDMAGKCFVSVAKKGENTCISVVLNAKTDAKRWEDTLELLDMGLNR